jgi:hypothetical protein
VSSAVLSASAAITASDPTAGGEGSSEAVGACGRIRARGVCWGPEDTMGGPAASCGLSAGGRRPDRNPCPIRGARCLLQHSRRLRISGGLRPFKQALAPLPRRLRTIPGSGFQSGVHRGREPLAILVPEVLAQGGAGEALGRLSGDRVIQGRTKAV